MKTNPKLLCAAVVLALGMAVRAEEYVLLKAKTELLVEQAKGLLDDSYRKGSESYGAPYQYYFGLMHATGTNLLARGESATNAQRLRKYCGLIEKDYEAYTKVNAAVDMAAATGADKKSVGRGRVIRSGSRTRVQRLINAEKLRDKELAEAVKRWEGLAVQLMKDPIKEPPRKQAKGASR